MVFGSKEPFTTSHDVGIRVGDVLLSQSRRLHSDPLEELIFEVAIQGSRTLISAGQK